MSRPNARAEAALAVAGVLQGRSLDELLVAARSRIAEPKDQALVQAIAFGVLRDLGPLSALLAQLLQRPLPAADHLGRALLLVGLFQLRSMRVPAHAALSETVEATATLARPRLRGLANAVLRRYQREREALEAALPRDDQVLYSMPRWLIDAIRRDWGAAATAVLTESNRQGPMTLRVNCRRGSREALRARLAADGHDSATVDAAPQALVLARAAPVERLPGFAEGELSVQDAAAQLAAQLLDVRDGQRVLDACCAPGGKTAHLLELAELELVGIDHDAARLERVRDTLARTGGSAQLLCADAAAASSWWDGRPFDRILIDAPCSGSGVIRRHPDIKWLRRADDIPRLAATQNRLLDTLWPLLAPGGRLLYATCSVLAAEGEEVARAFLMRQPAARHAALAGDWGETCRIGRRLAPGGAFDGFYYCAFDKPQRPR